MHDDLDKGRAELEQGCYLYSAGKFQKAIAAFQRAAKLGNREAQVNLANMLDSGEAGEKIAKKPCIGISVP